MENLQRIRLTADLLAASTAHDRGIISSTYWEKNICHLKLYTQLSYLFKILYNKDIFILNKTNPFATSAKECSKGLFLKSKKTNPEERKR